MMILSLLENRSFHRLTAVLAAGALLLATVPSRADDELLSLVMPSTTVPTGTTEVEPDDRFSPASQPGESTPAATEAGRLSVKVSLERIDTHEILAMDLPLDGRLGRQDVQAVAHFFRCRRTGRQRPMSPGVLALLADVAAQWPERTIEVISGLRAPPYGAPHSKHFKGQAVDLRIPGVRTTALRDHVWRQNRGVGVGYYAQENFVHMDSRPELEDYAWSGAKEGGAEESNPRWARRARRHLPTPRTMPEPLLMPYALAPTTGAGTI